MCPQTGNKNVSSSDLVFVKQGKTVSSGSLQGLKQGFLFPCVVAEHEVTSNSQVNARAFILTVERKMRLSVWGGYKRCDVSDHGGIEETERMKLLSHGEYQRSWVDTIKDYSTVLTSQLAKKSNMVPAANYRKC
ncbi:hypothetical protein SUGI_0044500 [Cryptomeria japonica]|nr:hypothetical protein SUGI_0044500 [Cryptomeria japonica]